MKVTEETFLYGEVPKSLRFRNLSLRRLKRQGIGWVNILAIYIPDKGLVSIIYREVSKFTYQETNNTIFKKKKRERFEQSLF